jgi:hypothetical protein
MRVIAVEPEEPDEPQVLWAGLVNGTGGPRFVCLRERLVAAWEVPERRQSQITGSSPHACRVEVAYSLVAAGETLFMPFAVPKWEWFADQASLHARIVLGFEAYSLRGSIADSEEHEIEWEGSIRTALQAGTEMAGPPAPR